MVDWMARLLIMEAVVRSRYRMMEARIGLLFTPSWGGVLLIRRLIRFPCQRICLREITSSSPGHGLTTPATGTPPSLSPLPYPPPRLLCPPVPIASLYQRLVLVFLSNVI